MKKPLKPKLPRRNTHPLLEHRLQTAAKGHSQCMCREKRGGKIWPTVDDSAEAILNDLQWQDPWYDGTALRITGNMIAADSDVSIPDIAELIQDDIYALDPEGYNRAIHRDSMLAAIANFWQWPEPTGHLSTHKYTAHPELLPDLEAARALPERTVEEGRARADAIRAVMTALDPQFFEIYGSRSRARLFQYEGRHSGEGATARYYRCSEIAPWNTGPDELPLLPLPPGELVDRIDALLAAHLTRIPMEKTAEGEVVYDLTPATLYYPKGAEAGTVEELAEGLEPGAEHGIRGCLLSTLASRSEANCNLYVSWTGRVMVVDWSHDGLKHYMKSEEPQPGYDEAALREALGRLDAQPARDGTSLDDIERGEPEATYNAAAAWLLRNVAYFTAAFKGRGGVIGIHPDSELRELVTVTSLRTRMMSFSYIVEGPRGGQHKMHPIDAWLAHPELIVIGGLRMRPELDRPRFVEDGVAYINRYCPPDHPTHGGTVGPFERRLQALVPDPAERRWVWNWIACLVQHPEWRMVGLAMVARQHGSGRGLFAETLQRVLGAGFVISLPYDNISGGSKFNAEIEGRLLVYVNEARHADSHKYGPKNATREALRVFVEPNHRVPQRIEPKGVDAYYTQLAISTLVLANSIKAVPIDANDRRFAVVINGPQMTVEERDEYQAWMLQAVNIGALYRHLRDYTVEVDKREFDPHMAPLFVGRDMMIEAGESDLDRAWTAATTKLKTAADLYAMSQIVALARSIMRSTWPDLDALVRTHTYEHGCRIGIKRPAEVNWRIRFGDDEDNRQAVFAFDEKSARAWTQRGPEEIKKELFKAQQVVDEPERRFNKALRLVKDGDEPAE